MSSRAVFLAVVSPISASESSSVTSFLVGAYPTRLFLGLSLSMLSRASNTDAGILASRTTSSRGRGVKTCNRFITVDTFDVFKRFSTLVAKSLSQAKFFTAEMLCSLVLLIVINVMFSLEAAKSSTNFFLSASRVSQGQISILFTTTINSLFANKGRILQNNEHCCSMVYPQFSLISTKYNTLHVRCASAVIACISIVFRYSSF
mmetsp:Transcript_27290/g.31574  ORF Transcript_27290/g.31574 Transcript_27290/m.31574 type:complete len:204 (+) Transcript_27290:1223-1834(+)